MIAQLRPFGRDARFGGFRSAKRDLATGCCAETLFTAALASGAIEFAFCDLKKRHDLPECGRICRSTGIDANGEKRKRFAALDGAAQKTILSKCVSQARHSRLRIGIIEKNEKNKK